ncbi:MAG: hypothetical protein ABL997_11125, partial [Planctomycetota bacterium]
MRPLLLGWLFAAMSFTTLSSTATAQSLSWSVPDQGALTYNRVVQRFAVTPPATSLKQEIVVASADEGGHTYRYFACPQNGVPAGFETTDFDDSAWSEGKGEFGTDVGKNANQRTHWGSDVLLLRSRVDLGKKKPKAIFFRISHDDGVRVFWNGEKLIENLGYGRDRTYIIVGKQLAAMTSGGTGMLAASCVNTGGAQHFDLAMSVLSSLPAGVKSGEDLQQVIDQGRQTADHVSREFFGAYRPSALLLHGELDAERTRVSSTPGDVRELAFFVACDLERGVTGGTYQQDIVRLYRLGDVQLRGKVLAVDAEGWQTMDVTVKNPGEPALRGDTKRFLQMHVLPHAGYGIDGRIQIRRRLELKGDRARVAEAECTFTARILRGKDKNNHAADFVQRETFRFHEERDGQDATFRIAVSKAIDRGTAFLRDKLSHLGAPSLRKEGDEDNRSYHTGRLALGLLALIKGGVKKDDPVLLRAMDELRTRPLIDTYSLGNALMAMEAFHSSGQDAADLAQGAIDRQKRRTVPAADKALMQKWTNQLLDNVDTRVDSNYLLRFNYVRDRRFDNSVNQYGLLGLYSAHLCGIDISSSLWEGAANHLISAQCESSGSL